MTSKKNIKNLLFLLPVIVLLSACGGDDNIFRVDYSDAPPLPDTTSAISKVTLNSGLIYYVITEGNPESYDVVIRDDLLAYYTTRLEDEEIVGSSYANGNTGAARINNLGNQGTVRYGGNGLVQGVLGMKEGERRVLVIPSDLNTIPTSETIIIDFELEAVAY